ncbi:hypothetical protein [Gimesia chilikensis]|uniref:WD domain, G-beta repeat n=1 Tax=Gimesia chilikensis TaxID=2605989 RepID=A0A517PSX6_9PLAN|nr:hypothetical protein [Gimesia chilikensis]QDT22475.1 hypothetical protein HG66A1_42830 [Gimesia chilikensis]
MSIRNIDGTFRFTAFRTAIARRLVTPDIAVDSPNHSTPDDPVRDLLGMTELRDRARRAYEEWWTEHGNEIATEYEPALREFCRELFFWTSADRFFASMPDADLYYPVPICLAKDCDKTWEDLADLLLKTAGDSHGLLISARSGGGKTVGSWCAWFRCFSDRTWIPYPNQPETHRLAPASAGSVAAPLAGFLPVWIDVADSTLLKGDEDGSILKLIARQCLGHLNLDEDARLRLLNRYLQLGSQKFLLFFDLNHAPAEVRDRYAEALIRFQNCYGPGLGHRCIVIYSATGQRGEYPPNMIHSETSAPCFIKYHLSPLNDRVAIDYLARIRNAENGLFDHLDHWLQNWSGDPDASLPRSKHDPKTELTHLNRLLRLRRWSVDCDLAIVASDIRKDDTEEQETFITIPLLMHWFSEFPPEVLDRIGNLSHIYTIMTWQHLEREKSDWRRNTSQLSSEDMLSALQRLALAILAQQGTTRLRIEEAKRLFTDPQLGNRRNKGRQSWMPVGDLLTGTSTYSRVFTENELNVIYEMGLLRKTRDSIGFAHDSLIYYFAARALREYDGAVLSSHEERLDATWPQAIANTLLDDPARWLLVVEFLGELIWTPDYGSSEEIPRHNQNLLRELVSRLVTFWPDLPRDEAMEFMKPVPELVWRLCSSKANNINDDVLRVVFRHTNQNSQFLFESPHLLLQEVLNECSWYAVGDSYPSLGREVVPWGMQLDRYSKKFDSANPHCRPEWLKKIQGVRLSDEEIYTDKGVDVVVYTAPVGLRIVAVVRNYIVIYNPYTAEVEQKIKLANVISIDFVAVYESTEGPRVVAGAGNYMNICNPCTGEVEQEIEEPCEHPDGGRNRRIACIVTYSGMEGPRIVSSSSGWIVIHDPQTGNVVQTIETPLGFVNSMSVYHGQEGPRIVLVGSEIVICDPKTGKVERILEGGHRWSTSGVTFDSVESAAVFESPDGLRLVSGGMDDRLLIRNLQNGRVEQAIAHAGYIDDLMVCSHPEGPRIISSSHRGIKFWDLKQILSWTGDSANQPLPISEFELLNGLMMAIDEANQHLFVGTIGGFEVYEFVTN